LLVVLLWPPPDIFYQLCVGCDAGLKGKLRLAPPNTFSYLNQSGCLEVDGPFRGLLASSAAAVAAAADARLHRAKSMS
jgi:hypothetical protein